MHQEVNKSRYQDSERFMRVYFGQLKHDANAFQAKFT